MRRNIGGEIQVHIKKHEQFAEISIKDNGVGMDKETLERVLEQPADITQGIGLPNTHRRLKQLYGEGLRISSELGQGITVAFVIPRDE